METIYTLGEYAILKNFLSYLWGMETDAENLTKEGYGLFLSYLWGMETLGLVFCIIFLFPFYPTYEEWKQILKTRVTFHFWKLFILPMRNGNESQSWYICHH